MNTTRSQSPAQMEPGLLQLFRLFTVLQFVLLLLSLFGLADGEDVGGAVLVVLMLANTIVLLAYLYFNRLRRWFGRFYLPLAILMATAGPIFARAAATLARLEEGITGNDANGEPTLLIVFLFVPMLMIAAQYGFRAVIGFQVMTIIIEVLLAGVFDSLGGANVDITVQAEVVRLVTYLAFGFIIARLISEQRQQRENLRRANEQLSQHAITLEQLAISRERNRMARDLHDTLAHTLSAVSIQLEAVTTIWDESPEKARQTVERIQQVTREGLQETRLALQALRTNPVEDLGLLLALRDLTEQLRDRAEIRVDCDLPEINLELPLEIENNIYRIIEEALDNVAEHAHAQKLLLVLRADRRKYVFVVQDNGIGFDTNAPSPEGHFGLVGMRERAEIIGGKLSIESELGLGTKVILEVEHNA